VDLLEAFREPVSAPSAPHLRGWFTPASSVPEPGVHAVRTTVDVTLAMTYGAWSVTCSCGWSKCGIVSRGDVPRDAFQGHLDRTARLWAARHLDNPLMNGTEDQ
jgi:hypothetical protein